MNESKPVRYLSAEVRTSDDFGIVFTMLNGEIIYDAQTKYGPWACMTEKSFKEHGIGKLGTGLGQKFVRQGHNGELHKVK